MTVYESIRNWLNEVLILSGHTEGAFIEAEQIPNEQGSGNAGIFSSPNDDCKNLMAGGKKYIEFKSFYYKNKFGTNADRVKNEEFFERFKDEVNKRNLNRDFPDDGRRWRSIEINGGIYPAQRTEDNQSADYLVPLKICYIQ